MDWPIPRQRIPLPDGLWRALGRTFLDPGGPHERTQALERACGEFLGGVPVRAVTSGRAALALLLRAFDLPPGAAVALPALTFHAVPAVVRDLGLRPVFLEVDPRTFNVSPEEVERALGQHPGIRAVVVTHTFGVPPDLTAIADLCRARGVPLIEDRAHVFHPDPPVTGCDAAFFSLETSKPLNGLGGGLAVTRHRDLCDEVDRLLARAGPPQRDVAPALMRQALHAALTSPPAFATLVYPVALLLSCFGQDLERRAPDPSRVEISGAVRPLSPFHAAVALEQMPLLAERNQRRAELARALDRALHPRVHRQHLPDPTPPLLTFSLVPSNREKLAAGLLRRGIDSKRDFLSDCPSLFGAEVRLPTASLLARRMLHLPLHPWLTGKDVERMAVAVHDLWEA